MRGFFKYILLAAIALTMLTSVESYAGPTVKLGKDGWLKINYEGQFIAQMRDTGSGPAKDDSTTDFYFRRNRLILIGQATEKTGFYYALENQSERRIQALDVSDTAIDTLNVLDAYIGFNLANNMKLRAGLWKDQLVREHNEGCYFPLSMDRSLFVYTSIPRVSRDYGVFLVGNTLSDMLSYKLSVTQGVDGADTESDALRYTGRAHISLLSPENLPLYFGTYLGKKKVLTVGAGYQMEKDAAYEDVANKTGAKDYTAWTVDGFFEYPTPAGTITASGAYLLSDFDDAYKGDDPSGASIDINGEKNGWYAKAGYMLPSAVGPGELQIYGRQEQWNFAELSGVFAQKINWTAAGLNYYLDGQNLRTTLEYSMNDFDKEDNTSKDFNTLSLMIQLLF